MQVGTCRKIGTVDGLFNATDQLKMLHTAFLGGPDRPIEATLCVYLSELHRSPHPDLVLLVPATGLTGCGKGRCGPRKRGPGDRGVTKSIGYNSGAVQEPRLRAGPHRPKRRPMNDAASRPSLSIGKLIVVPAVITLAVTILRLVGELENWAPPFFNKHPGGGGALIGISWLPIVFG